MWPSDIKVKNILCYTGVLLFKGKNLQLNPTFNIDNTILEKELLTSTINKLNTLFDQEEKFNLAVLLRDYIYSCRNLEQLRLDNHHFWKNYFQFLKNYLSEHPEIIFITLILSPLIIPLKWLNLKFSLWSAEKKIKAIRKSLLNAKEANHSNLINPLSIDYDPKLFEIPIKKVLKAPNLSTNKLIEKLAEITDIMSESFENHIGTKSTYRLKSHLKTGLQLIYYRLNGHFDQLLGPLQEKTAFVSKLYEGINTCPTGFHDRVNTLLESFDTVENFTELLYLVRKLLVEKTAIKLLQSKENFLYNESEIHTYRDFTHIAHHKGLGIPLETTDYRGDLRWDIIDNALEAEFDNSYTLFKLPKLLTDILRGILVDVGYTGAKEETSSYVIGSDDSEVEQITRLLKKFLSAEVKNTEWHYFFIINDESHIIDVNWKVIERLFLQKLIKENYFQICPEDTFKKNLLHLLNYIKNTNTNYFSSLVQIQPESLYLLLYRLEAIQSKEIQRDVTTLFLEKDKTGLNTLQLIIENNPKLLTRFFDFIDSNSSNQHIIQAFLIKKNNMLWDSFIYSTKKQPKSAFILLNYIIQHPELFKSDTHIPCSFLENLNKIQQGLSNLMINKNYTIIQKTILLSFLNTYTATLPSPSKKIVDFLFLSLSSIDDKSLIKSLITQHSKLLLENFSIAHFKNQNKNLDFIIKHLLAIYEQELTVRKNTHAEYTTQIFNFSFGHSATEKLIALTAFKAILNNKSANDKTEPLNKLKSDYPVLAKGRLSLLFKTYIQQDMTITSPPKIQPHI